MSSKTSHGKLAEKLRQIARGPVAPIGFGRTAEMKIPALALIVSLARNDPELAKAAIAGGADAVLLHLNRDVHEAGVTFGDLAAERQTIQGVASVAGDTPWGVDLGNQGMLSQEDLKALIDLGVDFVSADASNAPAPLLLAENIGRIVALSRDLSPYLLRTVNELSIDAVELSPLDRSDGSTLSILDVMKYRQFADLIRQPVIATSQAGLKPDDVRILREIGFQGLLLDAATAGADPATVEQTTRAFHQAIDQAGGPLARRDVTGVIIPKVSPRGPVREIEIPEEPEEEPDEEEW